jgi:hypothetical protein
VVRDFVKQAKDKVGRQGWAYLSPEMREALIAQRFVLVVLANDRGHNEVRLSALSTLYSDMLSAAGLTEGERPAASTGDEALRALRGLVDAFGWRNPLTGEWSCEFAPSFTPQIRAAATALEGVESEHRVIPEGDNS